jgi:hypothetical protein
MRKILKIKTKNKYDSINLGKLKDFISERISIGISLIHDCIVPSISHDQRF